MSVNDIPICIPSYKRWDRKDNKTLDVISKFCSESMRDRTYVFVRKEQESEYRHSFPEFKIITLPNVGGLSTTRQFIADYTLDELNSPYCIDVDDDITGIGQIVIDSKGKPHDRGGRETFEKCLDKATRIAIDAMELSNCVIGGLHRRHFSQSLAAAKTAYKVNAGPTPRHIVFQNVALMRALGLRRDPAFDPTGDDVGLVAVLAKARQSFFHIPCIVYSYVSDKDNSVIRNDGNRRTLATYEYEQLKRYPMGNKYLRIPFRFDDGSYRYSDIDFVKYRKYTGLPTYSVPLEQIGRK